jgi:NADH:ubiquinone oxidoreductase subunit F (NADH-binding)/NADH:ubiquinone oxidoreductase subunit E/Pyruvate/2-oxoacid:ferredoxin oxidoreductase delta subunit
MELDLAFVDQTLDRIGGRPDRVLPVLQALQRHYRYLPVEALRRVTERSDITLAQISSVSTFYSQFRHRPVGRRLISVCNGTACHVKGAERVYDMLRDRLHITGSDDTDPSGDHTVEKVFCLGCCTLAPVVRCGESVYGPQTTDAIPDLIRRIQGLKDHGQSLFEPRQANGGPLRGQVNICLDSCCLARGCDRVYRSLEHSLLAADGAVRIKRVACGLMCEQAPTIGIELPGEPAKVYENVTEGAAPEIIARHFRPQQPAARLRRLLVSGLDRFLDDTSPIPPQTKVVSAQEASTAAFFGPQVHIATEHFGSSDPLDLDEYLSQGGFTALERCLKSMQPEEVVEEVRQSGLRGRGGAGFPTGVKWGIVRQSSDPIKYVICNGDEGDPGAFMDRMLMESFPYRIIEGMSIAAHAMGAAKAIVYVRAEYPFAVQRMREALDRLRRRDVFRNLAAGHPLELEFEVFEGAGAFVCGEETALLESIEGRRGIPRLRPPYPAQRGLFGHPTLINNVETYANLPWIFRNGAAAFAHYGTARSKGAKVFALAGKTVRGGLIEVPMGITVRRVVEEIGGGIAGGRRFKAVLIGGPSGGCLPESLIDTPIDYESLVERGAIMGSGGLVVLDDGDCMVDVAKYFLSFCQFESCGRCTFCCIGTRRLLDILQRITDGEGQPNDLEELQRLCGMVKTTSQCGLGKTAPNPVITTLRYFREEYEAHLQGRCPAGVCKNLVRYEIEDNCTGCTVCAQHCPVGAIAWSPYKKHRIDSSLCTRCDACRQVCPSHAVKVN